MKFVRSFLQRLREDKNFRLNVAYAIVMPIYVAGIFGLFLWAIIYG